MAENQASSSSSEPEPGDSSMIAQEQRRRGGCLISWLVVASLAFGVLLVTICAVTINQYNTIHEILLSPVNISTFIFVVLGCVSVVGMWLWKKWGYYLLMTGFLVGIVMGVLAWNADTARFILGLFAGIVIGAILLYRLMHEKLAYFD